MDFIVDVQDVDVPVEITEDTIGVDLSESVIEVSLDGSVVCIPAGANWIDELYDVDTTTIPPTNGQALVWSTVLSQWVPGSVDTSTAVITEIYDYDGLSLVLNDLVYISSSHFVSRAIDNNSVNPVVGMVTGLLTPTTVEVTHIGYVDVIGPLESGEKVFISITGGFTNTPPVDNYIQCLGVAVSNTRFLLNPVLTRIKRLGL